MIRNKHLNTSSKLFGKWQRTTFICMLIALSACTQPKPDSLNTAASSTVQHVVLVSIDGLRPDAINIKNAPNLFKLSHSGLYYPKAQTIKRSVTLPSHTSMLTGLDSKRHKINENKLLPGYISFPTAMKLVKQTGQSTATLFSKKKLKFLFAPDTVDYQYGRGQNNVDYHQTSAANIAAEFSRVWAKNGFNLTFVHIREPDSSGHKHGWMSDDYINKAVTTADQAIAQIYNSIKTSPYANNTLLIITADHGGADKIHWSNRPEDLTIPWLAIHPTIKPEIRIDEAVTIYDTTPTILYLLGAPTPIGLDGRIVPSIQSLFPAREAIAPH